MHFHVPSISVISLLLQEGYATHKEKDGYGENGTKYGSPLSTLQRCRAVYENTNPDQHFSKVVGMA